jgi:hypothetical protein
MDTGRNGGISGVVDTAGNPSFGVKVYVWKEETSASRVDTTGQGSNDLSSVVGLLENGSVILQGKVRRDQFPNPNRLLNARGTLTMTLEKAMPGSGATDVKQVGVYDFKKVEKAYNEKDQTVWDVTIVGDRYGSLTLTGFGGTQTITSALASGNSYTYAGRQKLYDPNGLVDSSDQSFVCWGIATDNDAAEVTTIAGILSSYSTAPQTAEKQHTAVGERLSSGVMRIKLHWSPRSTSDDLLFPQTNSVRSYTDAFTDKVPFIVDSTLSSANLANAIANASQGAAYLHSVLVRPHSDGKKVVVFDYQNPGQLWRGSTKSGARQVMGRVNNAGVVELFVDDIRAYSNTRCLIYLRPITDYTVLIRDVVLFRVITSTVIPEAYPSTINGVALPYVGQANNATFQGLPAGTAVYQGVKFKVKIDQLINGALTMLMGYLFHTNSYGIVNGLPGTYVRRAYLRQFPGGYPSAQSWVSAATLGFPGCVVPTQGSFAAFVA